MLRLRIHLGLCLAALVGFSVGCDNGESSGGGGGGGNAPDAPLVTSPVANDTVTSPLAITGTAEPGATVSAIMRQSGNNIGTSNSAADTNGAFSFTITYTEPSVGTALTLEVKQTHGGSLSPATSVALVQGGPPDAPTITTPTASADIGNPVTVTGTADAGNTVTVRVLNGASEIGIDTGTATAGGTYSVSTSFTSPSIGTALTLEVTQTNAFGTSPEATVAVTYQPRLLTGDIMQNSGNTQGTMVYLRLYDSDIQVIDHLQEISVSATNGLVLAATGYSFEVADGIYYIRAFRDSGAPQGDPTPDGEPTLRTDAQASALGPIVIAGSDSAGNDITLEDTGSANVYDWFNVATSNESAVAEPPYYESPPSSGNYVAGDGLCRGYRMALYAVRNGTSITPPAVHFPDGSTVEMLDDGACSQAVHDNTSQSYDWQSGDGTYSYGWNEPTAADAGDYMLYYRDTANDWIETRTDNVATVVKLDRKVTFINPTGAAAATTTETISWQAVTGAAAYELRAYDHTGAYYVFSNSITQTSYDMSGDPMPDDSYIQINLTMWDVDTSSTSDFDATAESIELRFVTDNGGDTTVTLSGNIQNDTGETGDYLIRVTADNDYSKRVSLVRPSTATDYSMALLTGTQADAVEMEAYIDVDGYGDDDAYRDSPYMFRADGIDGQANATQDIFFKPPVFLISPVNGSTGVGNTPTVTWEAYDLSSSDWHYAVYFMDAASQGDFPSVIWGVPNGVTTYTVGAPVSAYTPYDLVFTLTCGEQGGTYVDQSTCNGASGTVDGNPADLSGDTQWGWGVVILPCNIDDFNNDVDTTPANGVDDYTDCLLDFFMNDGDTVAESGTWMFTTN